LKKYILLTVTHLSANRSHLAFLHQTSGDSQERMLLMTNLFVFNDFPFIVLQIQLVHDSVFILSSFTTGYFCMRLLSKENRYFHI